MERKGKLSSEAIDDLARGGPRTRHDTAWRDKQASEASRVLPGSRKSAELTKAGRRETSATRNGPASESVRRRAIEPMVDVPVEHACRQRGSGRQGLRACGVPGCFGVQQPRDMRATACQPATTSVVVADRIPHGIKSVSKTDERSAIEPKNLGSASSSIWKMTEATGDRRSERRSPRSSPSAGKPRTWRRGTVGTECQQEVGSCPAR